MMQAKIHLIQGFLYMADVLCGHLYQTVPMSPQTTNCTDLRWRSETRAQESDRVQVLNPLTIGDIRFAAWHVFHGPCIDQIDLKTMLFKNLVHGNPINAC